MKAKHPLFVELTNLRAKPQYEIIQVLYGLHCKFDHDTIHDNICEILKLTLECDNNLSDPELLYAWFEIHSYSTLIDEKVPLKTRKKFQNQLLDIVGMVEETKAHDEIVYKLKLLLIKNSVLNPAHNFQSLAHLENVENCKDR